MTVTERNQLILNYMPLAHKLAYAKKKILPKKFDLDDLKSAAFFGLVNAALKFDSSKSSFGTYATIRICGEIQDFIRNSYKHNERYGISLDVPNDNGECLANSIPQGNPTCCEEFFEEITSKLNDLDKNVILLYYVDNLSLKEIGEKIGVSESRVSQLLKRSKKNVKEAVIAA